MRLALHTVICCCVITTVLPVLVKGATGDIRLKKRIRAWLQNHMKTDLHNSLGRAKEQLPDKPLRPQQGGLMNIVSPASSFGLKIRSRRSASSKPSGCLLFTCAFQDLLHRLHNIKGRQKMASAPEKKISSNGYGRRRRRSLQDLTQSNFQIERQNTEDDLPLCSYEICTEA